jgi:hypothetical protein
MGQSVMFDHAKKAFLAQARQKSPGTPIKWLLELATSGLARIILGKTLGFPKCTIELKGAKERGS